jgi:asparagine synthase (glutamine-hydrolysing)
MCGIAGIISLQVKVQPQDAKLVLEMVKRIKHRGPNRQSVQAFAQCVLGNARLNIIDLSDTGNMPMSNSDGTVWITYNGEVSNFRQLKNKFQLEKKYSFQGTSDTEVLVHLYEEMGIAFIHLLSGMFAFCLYDSRIEKVFLVRDFFGINPVFYSMKGDKIYFASEIKALLEIPDFNREVDREALTHYFTLGYIPHRLTPFKNICELRPSEMLEADLNTGTFKVGDYYRLNYEENFDISEEEATKKVYELMLDSVERNLISDAPLGIALSGGVDSSSILALARKLERTKQMHTFSIKLAESTFDESRYQQIMTKYAGSIHHEVLVTPGQIEESMMAHLAYMDEPVANAASIPNWLLAKRASQEVSVLLSGEGGDELFNAYDTHLAYKIRELYKRLTPGLARKFIYALSHTLPSDYSKLSLDFKMKRFTEGADLDAPDAHMYWRHIFTNKEKALICLNADSYPPTESFYRNLWNNSNFEAGLNKISLIDIRHFFVDDLMLKNDRMFLAHSVESRYPLMDKILFDYVSQLPAKYKIKGFKTRYIQKKAMEDILPKEILRRPKFGLDVPFSNWLTKELKRLAEKYLNKKSVEKTGMLNWAEVEKIWHTHLSRKRDHGRALWSIIMLIIWFELFIDSNEYKKYLPS